MSNLTELKNKALKLTEQAKALLSSEEEVVVELKEATLTDGTIVKYDSLVEGADLTVVTSEGEMPAPDGVHELEDGTLVETKEGKITQVTEAPVVEIEEEMFSELKAQNEELKKELEALKNEFSAQGTKLEKGLSLFAEFSEILQKAASEPAAAAAARPMSKLEALKQINKK